MPKVKYYQLAFKNTECKKLVSPNQKELDSLTADGYTLFGFDNEADMPQNPILVDGTVREMTAAEITAKKLTQTVFDRMDILDAFNVIGKKTDLLNALSTNAEFSAFWSASTSGIDLGHPVCVQAIAALELTQTQINEIKLIILGA